MDGQPSGVVTDPVAVVVELVGALEPNLSPGLVEGIVTTLATGRATQRRLAKALSDRPGLLADGRSPAQRVVGDLLIALLKAGATHISPPCCATCGKHLRTFQRRGEHWYCAVCASKTVPCSSCGRTRKISFRDRAGEPRCHGCPPDDGVDPMEIVLAVVAMVDPHISAETVTAAVMAVTSRAGQRRQLAWALEDRPELLTGAGGEAAVPSVLRLIEVLCSKGATGIVRPACPHCRRVIALSLDFSRD